VVVGFVLGSALDWVWQLPVVPIVALAALGLLVGPATLPRAGAPGPAPAPRAAPPNPPPRAGFLARAALVLVAWLVVVAQAIPFLGNEEIGSSRRAAARGDLAEAVDHARSAQAIEPWAASPGLQLALAYEGLGDLANARRRLAEAIERDPQDWRLRVIDARLAVKAGDIPAARRALARARELNPRSRLLRARTR
jgi:tetratricopeptide (TPR) repeat protein